MSTHNYTAVAVGIFIAALLLSRCEEAKSEPYIGLGTAVFNSHVTTGEVGYRFDKWDLQLAVFGEGDTKKGYQRHVEVISFSRIVVPEWRFGPCDWFMRLGIAYVHDSPLVGKGNYRLGIGCNFGVWDLEYGHFSSANINHRNTGVDGFGFRIRF